MSKLTLSERFDKIAEQYSNFLIKEHVKSRKITLFNGFSISVIDKKSSKFREREREQNTKKGKRI